MKAKRGKCLALVAVLAMVVCAFAVALPAEESNAGSIPTTATALTATIPTDKGGDFYLESGSLTLSVGGAYTYNIYLKAGASVKIDGSAIGTFNIYVMTTTPTSSAAGVYVDNLKVVGAQGKTYTAMNDDGYRIKADESMIDNAGSTIGAETYDGTNYYAYPTGCNVNFSCTLADSYVSVLNGSATFNQMDNSATAVKKHTVTMTSVESTDGVKVVGVAAAADPAAPTISGTYTEGTVEVTLGSAAISGGNYLVPSGNKAVLNGFASANITTGNGTLYAANQSAQTTAATPDAMLFAFGTVTAPSGVVGSTTGVTLVNATVSDLQVNGGVHIKAAGATTSAAVKSDAVKLTAGTLTLVSGDFSVDEDDMVIGAGTTLVVANKATVTMDKDDADYVLGEGAVMNVFGTLKTTEEDGITITDAGSSAAATFNAYSGAVIGDKVYVSTYYYNINGATKEFKVTGDLNSDITFSQFQIVRVTEDITIAADKTVCVLGKLIIDEGASITVSKNAQLLVGTTDTTSSYTPMNNTAEVEISGDMDVLANGTFVVAGGKSVTITGDVDVAGDMIVNAATTMKSGSVVTIEDGATLDATEGLTVSKGALLTLEGNVGDDSSVSITNKGEIVLDGATIVYDTIISMAGDGAVVDIREMNQANATNKTLTITDSGLTLATSKEVGSGDYSTYTNSVTIAVMQGSATLLTEEEYMASDLMVVESVSSYVYNDVTYYNNYMVLSGAPGAKGSNGTELTGTAAASNNGIVGISVAAGCGAQVNDALDLGKGITFANTGTLTVNGQLTDLEGSVINNASGTIYVYGEIQSKSGISTGTVNAASYRAAVSSVNYYFYTTLAAAIEDEQTDITMNGSTSVTTDMEIPAGVTVSGADGAKLTIGSASMSIRDNTVTVEDGAVVKNLDITVDSTLVFEANKKSNKSNICNGLKFQNNLFFFGELSGLRKCRGLATACFKSRVSFATFSTNKCNNAVTLFEKICKNSASFIVFYNCSARNFNDKVFSAFSSTVSAFTIRAIFCTKMFCEFEINKTISFFVSNKNHTATMSAIATIWATFANELFSVKRGFTISPLSCLYVNFNSINKHFPLSFLF